MPKVNVTRTKTATKTIARRDVKTGQVFQLVRKDGSFGDKLYAALGHNGKWFSVNLGNGELSSTDNGASKVAVVGKISISTKLFHTDERRETTRAGVKTHELFRSKTGSKTYAHMGTLSDGRFASVNMEDPYNDNYAVSDNGRNPVVVVGTYEIHANVV